MSDPTIQTYAARLVIALPGQNQAASLVIALAPNDAIPMNGRIKPLADCTLADLRVYADTLEQQVWQAYEQITLLDLEASPEVEVEVTLLTGRDQAAAAESREVKNWETRLLVLLPAEKPAMATTDAGSGTAEEAPFTAETSPAEAEVVPAAEVAEAAENNQTAGEAPQAPGDVNTTDQVQMTAPVAGTPAAVPATAQEPVFVAEQEDDLDAAVTVGAPLEEEDEEPAPSTSPSGVITPSKARVRVAGERRPLGDRTWMAVDILMDEPALRVMQAHALTSLDHEVAGVMIGPRPEKQPDGRYLVHVIDAIAAKYTVMHGASVTYTPESWRYLNDTLHERYPDETAVMVGWYHTHPGFGIFLSGMDLFIHQNFFTQVWHVAYVLDPRARTSGFFCWDRPKSKVNRHDFVWPDWAAGSW
jgi:proteasome lid subunit RPN8/RPN11